MAAAAVASLTALILGEYELTLGTSVAAGLVVGLGLPEVVLGIARWRGPVPAAAGALLGGGSLLWAGWISSGRGVAPFRATAWIGVALAAVLCGARLLRGGERHRAQDGVAVAVGDDVDP